MLKIYRVNFFFFFPALHGFKPFSTNALTSSRRSRCHQKRTQARGPCGSGGKACSRGTQWGWRGRPEETRRRCHAARGTDNRHPPAQRPPSRALRADLAHPDGEAGLTPGHRGREWRGAGPRQQQIRPADHDSGADATETQARKTEPVSDTRSGTGCPLTTAASLRQHVDRKGPPPLFAPPPSVRSAPAPPTPAGGGLPVPGRGPGGKEQGDRKKKSWGRGRKGDWKTRSILFFSEKEKSKGRENLQGRSQLTHKLSTASVDSNIKVLLNFFANFPLPTSSHSSLRVFCTSRALVTW